MGSCLDKAGEVRTLPIAGVVISAQQEKAGLLEEKLRTCPGVEIHGRDEKGHLIAVLEAASKEGMEGLIRRLEGMEGMLHLGVTFLANDEDSAGEGV